MRTDEIVRKLRENSTTLLVNNANLRDLDLFIFLIMNLDRLEQIEWRDLIWFGQDLKPAFNSLLDMQILKKENDEPYIRFCGLPLDDWRKYMQE